MWVDLPLGPPWYKHACFDSNTVPNEKLSLVEEYKLTIESTEQGKESRLVIGIVKSTRVDILKRYTDISFETGKQETQNIRMQHNADFLLGKLCVHDTINGEIWPVDEPSYIFVIYKTPALQTTELVNCPKCDVKLNPKNLYKHLRWQHGIS